MRFSAFVFLFGSLFGAAAASAQQAPPPGAYRTATAYARRQPQPAGNDVSFPDKRGQLVVAVPKGARTTKVRIEPDSVWGYVNDKGRSFRIHRGSEYLLEHADTICVYSSIQAVGNGQPTGVRDGRLYYFSRGLTGLVFPLTVRNLRAAYEASNPAFVAALGAMRFDQGLSDIDRKTGLFRVTTIYREAESAPSKP